MKSLRKENIMCFRTKVSLLMLALFIGAGVFTMSVRPAEATEDPTIAGLQKIIVDLKAQIIELQSQLTASQQGDEDTAEWCHTFRRNLRYGSTGPEVRALQTALEKEELYEAGKKDASGKFGIFTSAAVVAFQEKYAEDILAGYGLANGTGFVGKTTIAKLNALYGCAPGAPESPESSESSEPQEPPVSPVTRGCTDTDGGIEKYVQGTACRDLYFVHPNLLDTDSADSSAKKSFTKQFCRTDRCIARNITPKQNSGEGMPTKLKTRDAVKEYYCRGSKIFSKIIYCEDGCYDGACKGGPEFVEPTCAVEGESVVPGSEASDCCEGLSKISCAEPDDQGVCPTEPCVGTEICANCGDDICGTGENKCNCPQDCPESSTEECTTDEDCEAGGCPQVVGGDQPKCDLTTNTCYCGGDCEDGYCDFVEERDETCPEDCDTTQ